VGLRVGSVFSVGCVRLVIGTGWGEVLRAHDLEVNRPSQRCAPAPQRTFAHVHMVFTVRLFIKLRGFPVTLLELTGFRWISFATVPIPCS